jgi:hypothetical protein
VSNLSVRAFDQARRRHLYGERRGIAGLAHIQKDILEIQRSLSSMALIFWAGGVAESNTLDVPSDLKNVQEHLSDAGLRLLQLSGSLGIDFVSLLRQRIEMEEITIL